MRPHLTSVEISWTDAVFGAIFPAPPLGNDASARPLLVHGIGDMAPGRWLDGILQWIPFEPMLGIRLSLWMIAFSPLFVIGKLGTIASIDASDRERVLERLVVSRIYLVRQMTIGLKAVATMLYAQSKAIRSQMATPLRPTTAEPLVTLRLPPATRDTNERSAHVAA